MAALEEPFFGTYGTWEARNPDCVARGLDVSNETRMIILLFASICFCQVLFMASRAPRVTWEAVYLPMVETVLYGMAASGNGQMRLSDGRVVPMARFCSWLITCPIMLFQVVALHNQEWYGMPVRNMVMAASLIRTVLGIGASISEVETTRWVQYGLSCGFFFFELFCVYQIYGKALHKFSQVKTRLNNIVYARIILLRSIFYFSWNSFPIIWLLSNTGLCLISEDATVLAYLVADMICKNLYGIINTNTLFQVLNGSWEPDNGKDSKPIDRLGETYLEMMIERMRGTRRDYDEDESVDDEEAAVPGDGQAVDVPPLGQEQQDQHGDAATSPLAAFTRPQAREAATQYAESMLIRNKNPEIFLDERDLPRTDLASRQYYYPRAYPGGPQPSSPRHQDVCVLVSDRGRQSRPAGMLSPRSPVAAADRSRSPQRYPQYRDQNEGGGDLRPERLSKEELVELVKQLGSVQAHMQMQGSVSPRSSLRASFRGRERRGSMERLQSEMLYQPSFRSASRERRASRSGSPMGEMTLDMGRGVQGSA